MGSGASTLTPPSSPELNSYGRRSPKPGDKGATRFKLIGHAIIIMFLLLVYCVMVNLVKYMAAWWLGHIQFPVK